MPRLARYLITALITFTIGVVVATTSRVILPQVAHLKVPRCPAKRIPDRPRNSACDGWKETDHGLGWDLTYLPLLRKAGVCPGHMYCEVATEKPQPPVNKHFAEWQGEPIISSILIELPDGHAEMEALWLIRTKQQAYWWKFHPQRPNRVGKLSLPAQHYDRVFQAFECWRPHIPQNKTFFEGRGDGYMGYLSVYKEGKSRQVLLTSRDLYETWPVEGQVEEANFGRFYKTLRPVLSAMREQLNQASELDAREPSGLE